MSTPRTVDLLDPTPAPEPGQLVAAILGISLMFVGVMVALNASVQQRVSTAQAQIGTGITITPAGGGAVDSAAIAAARPISRRVRSRR